jgi:hypothetical protein|tara:strand:+ start:1030 stop:1488 length:459 start_codon:yes stop_codon:yes gene_type:complete
MSHLEYDVMYGGKTQYEGELKWLRVVYENKTLREEIDCFLADGYKINAIRIFMRWCEREHKDALKNDTKPPLRISKDTVETYYRRRRFATKMLSLMQIIADPRTGLLTGDKDIDYKFVMEKWELMDKSLIWNPNRLMLEDMNRMYKKYKVKR